MTDPYSKVILTIIAGALVGLLLQNAIRPVGAANSVQQVIICDAYETNRCARVAEEGMQSRSSSSNYLLAR